MCRNILRQRRALTYARALLTIALAGLLSACLAVDPANRWKGPGWYKVKPTDTLYSIAWRYGLDYQELARWNGLDEPFRIVPGQQLTLIKPQRLPQPDTKIAKVSPPAPVARTAPATRKPDTVKSSPRSTAIGWKWPTNGRVLNRFSYKDISRRGIDIAGKIGQPVYAVADGKVVYSGNGLAGYGNLIIVKHDNTFLSAYAFNRKRLVEEGKLVKRGSPISEMGVNKDKQPVLHFQIRKNGKPVDPLKYLPGR